MKQVEIGHTSSVIIMNNEGKILLSKRKAKEGEGMYGFPGGKSEKGEKPIKAAKRELEEELGIKATQLKKIDKRKIRLSKIWSITLFYLLVNEAMEKKIKNIEYLAKKTAREVAKTKVEAKTKNVAEYPLVKKILEEFREDNELNYEQNITLNHLERFDRYSAEDAEEIFQKLQDDFGLRAKVAAHIVDLVPKDLADMRLIFAKEPSKTDKEDMEKILEFLEQYDVEE